MKRVVVSQTGAGNVVVPLNYDQVAVGVALAVVVSGSVTYTIQHTYDDIYDPTVTPTWWSHGVANLNAATTSQEGNYVIPVAAARLLVTAGSGTATLTVLQQGII